MVRKFVGKILPNIMELTKGDMDKKQDKMDALTAEDMKDMYPPFSVKEELSKSAPVQITLLDDDDQPIVGQSFSVMKSNKKLTSGKTNNSGVCVYNEPEVMTCDATPFTLEYTDQSIEVSMEYSNGSYASFNIKQNIDGIPTVEITDTDAGPYKILLAHSTYFQGRGVVKLELYKSEEDRDNRKNAIKILDMTKSSIGNYEVITTSDEMSEFDFENTTIYTYIIYPDNTYTQNKKSSIRQMETSDYESYKLDFNLSDHDKAYWA